MMTLLAICSVGQEVYAQNEQDIVRFGYIPLTGSARYIGMGGAFNALGGDMSAVSSNPAGAAVFLSNEMQFTLGFNGASSQSTYLGRTSDNLESKVTLPSFGIVSANTVKNTSSKWKAVNLGFTYNRLKDFNAITYFRAQSPSSLVDQFVLDAQGYTVDQLQESQPLNGYLAYQTYLIEQDSAPGQYFSYVNAGDVKQNYSSKTFGKIGENLFTLSANYDNKLYIGGSVGIIGVNYNLEEVYREETVQKNPGNISEFTYRYNLSTQGTGFNGKLGMIYRVSEALRFGFSYQTPTTFRMTDEFSASANSRFGPTAQDSIFDSFSDAYQAMYNVVIPGKIGFGVSYLFGKKGLISVDYNRQDLSTGRFNNRSVSYSGPTNYDFSTNNQLVSQYLTPTNQIKVGGELKLERLSLRAGVGYYDSPFKKMEGSAASAAVSISGGLGYNFDSFSIDFGLANTSFTRDYYTGGNASPATVKNGLTSANISMVFRY